MFLLYSALARLVFSLLLLPECLRRPRRIRRRWLREKLGAFPELRSSVWVHAVSVGEVNAALPFLKKLRSLHPGLPIVLSTVTDTGQKVAAENAPEGTHVVYLPFDIPSVLERAVRRIRPRAVIVIETEIWPNLFRTSARRGVPVFVLNGRISERSARGYRRIAFFMRQVLAQATLFGMQSAADADRIRACGAPEEKVRVTGNFKFDLDISGEAAAWAEKIPGPVVVAGSTHRGEEKLVLSAYQENLRHFPTLKLIIAPRHPERFAEAEEILKASGLAYRKRTEIDGSSASGLPAHCVILLDTVGELSALYRFADIAVIGKSLLGFGGQNPLEPAFWGKPIICGPHMENFPFISDFLREGAAFEADGHTLAKKIKSLLIDPAKAAEAGRRARELFLKNAGAVDRAVEIVRHALN
ncbi:MAG: 3-deoxy-D-manno-octulosonic acid transferase [Thermodesulfovibrionales bacterium]